MTRALAASLRSAEFATHHLDNESSLLRRQIRAITTAEVPLRPLDQPSLIKAAVENIRAHVQQPIQAPRMHMIQMDLTQRNQHPLRSLSLRDGRWSTTEGLPGSDRLRCVDAPRHTKHNGKQQGGDNASVSDVHIPDRTHRARRRAFVMSSSTGTPPQPLLRRTSPAGRGRSDSPVRFFPPVPATYPNVAGTVHPTPLSEGVTS